jgi:NADH dehydrogenase FAD-containing subunit
MMGQKPGQPTTQTLVLVGAGHAHLAVAAAAPRLVAAGLHPVLIDPGWFWYSGLATGMLAGRYAVAADCVDPAALIQAGGGQAIADRVVGLDRVNQQVHLARGAPLRYDLLSFNVGSVVATGALVGLEHAWPVKPIGDLASLRAQLSQRFAQRPDQPMSLAVLGGGATGCEIAAALRELAFHHRARVTVQLFTRGKTPLAGERPGAIRRLTRALHQRGIAIHAQCDIKRIEPNGLVDSAGRFYPAEQTVLATGLKPPDWLHDLSLCISPAGLKVDHHLQAVDDPRIFAAGDCIDFHGQDLPKLGVFGVRQGPVLVRNLIAQARGERLTPFQPQKRYLRLLNLGRGEALALRGRWSYRGRSMMWLKDRIDRRFLARYHRRAFD